MTGGSRDNTMKTCTFLGWFSSRVLKATDNNTKDYIDVGTTEVIGIDVTRMDAKGAPSSFKATSCSQVITY